MRVTHISHKENQEVSTSRLKGEQTHTLRYTRENQMDCPSFEYLCMKRINVLSRHVWSVTDRQKLHNNIKLEGVDTTTLFDILPLGCLREYHRVQELF